MQIILTKVKYVRVAVKKMTHTVYRCTCSTNHQAMHKGMRVFWLNKSGQNWIKHQLLRILFMLMELIERACVEAYSSEMMSTTTCAA